MPGGGDLEVQVALEVQNLAVISYGYSGTARKLVERIAVVNTGGAASAGTLVRPRVRVAAQLAEPLVTEWTGAAKALPAPGAPEITWDDAANPLNKKLIASLRQAPPADLVVEILAGEATVGSFQMPLTVLLPNQWMHAPGCFEALAGFVNHNDPALHAVMKQANALLKQRTKLPESLGYRRDAEHVQQVAGAVFDALSALGIEEVGGTFGVEDTIYAMRPLAAILGGKRATALELVLVVAACLAKAKLDPVIIFAGTTVYAGYALIPDQADARWDAGEQAKLWARLTPYAVVEYQKALAKLLSLGLVQVLDTVGAIGDGGPQARTADGKQRHMDVDPAGLQAMVVVRKAWESGISFAPVVPAPVAETVPVGTVKIANPPGTIKSDAMAAPVLQPKEVSSEGREAADGNNVPGAAPPVVPPINIPEVPEMDPPVQPLTETELGTIAEAMQVEPEIWFQISHWAKESQKLNPFQRSLAYSMGRLRAAGKEPSIKQAKWALVLHQDAYNSGFTPG